MAGYRPSTTRVVQPSFTAGELSPALYARTDLAKYQSGLRRARNVFVHPHGGVSNRPGFEFLGAVGYPDDMSRETILIPFQYSVDDTVVIEMGDYYFRFWSQGAPILNDDGTPYQLPTVYPHTDTYEITWIQEADLMIFFHRARPIGTLTRFGRRDWRYDELRIAPSIEPPAAITATDIVHDTEQEGQIYRPRIYQYAISTVSAADGEESLPRLSNFVINDLNLQGNRNLIQWTGVPGAEAYLVYKNQQSGWGYIGRTETPIFTDENIVEDRSDTFQKGRHPFAGEGNYPRCGTFHEQRLVVGGTLREPQAVYMSQTGNYRNFGIASPAKDSDAVTFRLRSKQVNEIRSLVSAKSLLMLTSGAEWLVQGGGDAGTLSPSNVVLKPQSYRGAAILQPIVVGNTLLFAQAIGGVIRDFSYQFSEDGFVGQDLTLLARHFFKGRRIVSWAYAQSPDSIVWVVLDDGSLLALTYLKEHEVWAWSKMEIDGLVRNVVTVAEGQEDAVYIVVRRDSDFGRRTHIERLHTRVMPRGVVDAFFLDSALTYEGPPVRNFFGLEHLEGRIVNALGDGNVYRDLVVRGGRISLPNAHSVVHVGLPYVATVETLDIDTQVQGLGSMQNRFKAATQVTMRVEETRGIFVGPRESEMTEYKQRASEAWGAPIDLFSGAIEIQLRTDTNRHGRIVVQQSDPLPFTIDSIAPDYAFNG